MTEDSEDEKASEASEDGDEEDEDGNDDVSESLEVWNENTSLLSWSVGQELGFAGGGKHNVGGTTCVFSCGCNFGHVTLIEEDKEDWPNIAAGVGVRGLGWPLILKFILWKAFSRFLKAEGFQLKDWWKTHQKFLWNG